MKTTFKTGDQIINLSGCLTRAQDWFTRNMIVVGSIAVAVAVLEVSGARADHAHSSL